MSQYHLNNGGWTSHRDYPALILVFWWVLICFFFSCCWCRREALKVKLTARGCEAMCDMSFQARFIDQFHWQSRSNPMGTDKFFLALLLWYCTLWPMTSQRIPSIAPRGLPAGGSLRWLIDQYQYIYIYINVVFAYCHNWFLISDCVVVLYGPTLDPRG